MCLLATIWAAVLTSIYILKGARCLQSMSALLLLLRQMVVLQEASQFYAALTRWLNLKNSGVQDYKTLFLSSPEGLPPNLASISNKREILLYNLSREGRCYRLWPSQTLIPSINLNLISIPLDFYGFYIIYKSFSIFPFPHKAYGFSCSPAPLYGDPCVDNLMISCEYRHLIFSVQFRMDPVFLIIFWVLRFPLSVAMPDCFSSILPNCDTPFFYVSCGFLLKASVLCLVQPEEVLVNKKQERIQHQKLSRKIKILF